MVVGERDEWITFFSVLFTIILRTSSSIATHDCYYLVPTSLSLPTLILQLNLNEIPREESDNTWKGISRFSAGFPLILPYVYINGHTMAATLQKMYWFKLHTSIYFSTKLAENRQIHVCIHIADGRMVFDIYPYCVYYVCNCRTFLYVVPKLLFY